MRTLAIIIGMAVIVTCAQAQAPAPQAPGSASPAPRVSAEVTKIDRSITLELNDIPIPDALDRMFNVGSTYYMTENARRILRDYQVNLKLKNAALEDALKAILQDHACFVKEGDNYAIMTQEEFKNYHGSSAATGPQPGRLAPGGYGGSYGPGGFGSYGSRPQLTAEAAYSPNPAGFGSYGSRPQLTPSSPVRFLNLPATPVEDAYKTLMQSAGGTDPLGWKFSGNLGKTMMPGAKLTDVSLEMAAEMIVAAAGLMPPTQPDGQIKAKPKGSSGYMVRIPDACPSVLLGYKGQDGVWKHTFKLGSVPVALLIRNLFDSAGINYYIVPDTTGADGKGGSRIVSIQMVDMTLNEILDTLLPPVGLTYTKKGDVVIVKPAGPGGSTGAKAAPSKGIVLITEPDPRPLPPTKPIADIPGSQAPGDARGF